MIFRIGNLLGLGGGWGRSSNFDLASLSPCRSALQQHIYRSNYQVGVWKRAHIAKPSIPEPDDGNGWTSEKGVIQPKWTHGEVMPKELVDILEESIGDSDTDTDSEIELEDNDLIVGMSTDSGSDSDDDNN